MLILLVFGVFLYIGVLLSGPAERNVLSTAVLFLLGGIVLGPGVLGLVRADSDPEFLQRFTEIALISVLFIDGLRFDIHAIGEIWRLPGRALVFGLPLALLGTAVLAHLLLGLAWPESFLLGAVLSPTDPVFSSAIIHRVEVPSRIRRLLNVEAGFNDGLALPAVVIMLGILGEDNRGIIPTLEHLTVGLAIGVVVAWLAIRLGSRRFLPPTRVYQPLHALSIVLMALGMASLLDANLFYAAFAAGITIASICKPVQRAFQDLGESVSELLKLILLLLFGTLISLDALWQMNLGVYVFAVLTLAVIRPLAVTIALLGSGTTWQERLVVAWFGPKGFASLFYALLVLQSGMASAEELARIVGLVVTLSIIAHSSTDVVLARWVGDSVERDTSERAVDQ